MREWLKEKEEAYKNAFNEFIEKTVETIAKIEAENPEKKIEFRIVFKKDEWLDNRSVLVEFVSIKENSDETYSEELKKIYYHSKTNNKTVLPNKGIINKLMKEGILTNTWFSILDSTRNYDTTILFTSKNVILENEEADFRENMYRFKSFGFNGIDEPVHTLSFNKSNKR